MTSGPAASPSRLFASVRVPSAVARIDSAVRFETIAPAGPAVPAAKKTPTASSSSWAPPGGQRESDAEADQRHQRVHDGRGPLADRDVSAEAVGDRAADDHAGAHEQDGDGGDAGGLARRQAVGAAEVAGQPGEQRAGDEQLQAAAEVGGR